MIVLLRNFKNVFLVPGLRRKVFFTLGVLAVFRFGVHIPIPGIDSVKLAQFMGGMSGGLMTWLDLVSGGALRKFAIFALGIGPYITASIMMTLLASMIPYYETLAKEGEYGRGIINQHTRYLTLLLSIAQGSGIVTLAEAQGLALSPGWGFRLLSIFILSVGSLFVMWLGEQISAHGIGNGSSLIIFSSIVARVPEEIFKVYNNIMLGQFEIILAVLLVAITLGVAGCVVFMEKGERKIPVQYAKRVIGNKIYGGQSSYIPLKINVSGVLPVIFAGSMIGMPMMIISFLSSRFEFLKPFAEWLAYGGFAYYIILSALIFFLAFLCAAMQLNPDEVAENMRKSGGFVPGIRPGRKTSEFFNYVLNRVTFFGAMYLVTLTVFPGIIAYLLRFPTIFSGISLLIVVGVALDTSAQVESFLIERRYEGFLSSGRMRGRRTR